MNGTLNFWDLQEAQRSWSLKNFGKHTSDDPLMGLMEELGELSHAQLKGKQGIRHTPEEIAEKKKDAVADIVIYLVDYCSCEGIDLQSAIEETWAKVSKRDWSNKPMDAAAGELA